MIKIVEDFEQQVNIHPKSSSNWHQSSANQEKIISIDLKGLGRFEKEDGRVFESLVGISHDPICSLDLMKFAQWIHQHKRNILVNYSMMEDHVEQSDELIEESMDHLK